MLNKAGKPPLRRLRLRLTLLSTGLTGAVLLVMTLVALSLAEGQLRASGSTAFISNLNAIVLKLQSDRVMSTAWLAQTEAADRLIISIADGGVPLHFSGSWSPDTPRAALITRAREAGAALGVDTDAPPVSVIEITSLAPFQVWGEQGDRYLASVALIPAHNSWQSLVLLRDMSAADAQILLLRLGFSALVLLGMGALFLLCWFFSGRAIAPIEESQRKQVEFIAAASHELRSPLTVIRTSASALGVAPEETERLRGNIEGECTRMARLVDDLLSLARSDAGTWSILHEQVDLDTLLLETAEGFYPVARQKRQSLLLDVPDTALPSVPGDSQRLRQLLTVLLDNAFSYTPVGGAVTLSGSFDERCVCLRVSDSGPGIPPEHLGHIFDRFYRADPARNAKNHFGLGLSIARELAALHGGSLQLTETSPAGTTFELRLHRN